MYSHLAIFFISGLSLQIKYTTILDTTILDTTILDTTILDTTRNKL